MSANHYPLEQPLTLAVICTLLGVYKGCDNALEGEHHRQARYELYKLQLIEKSACDRPVLTDKGRAYLTKLSNAVQGITLTPRPSRIEWV